MFPIFAIISRKNGGRGTEKFCYNLKDLTSIYVFSEKREAFLSGALSFRDIFTMQIARYKAITADLRSLFPFPPSVLRTFSFSFAPSSRFRFHSRSRNTFACGALTIGMECNRYHASRIGRQVDLCVCLCVCIRYENLCD